MPSVVLCSTLFQDVTRRLRGDLPGLRVEAIDLGTRARPPSDETLEGHHDLLADAVALLPIRGVIDERVLRLAPGCRIIQQFGVGVDTVDLDAARRRRIPVCNVPSRIGGNGESVAEMALLHLIAAGRELKVLQRMVLEEDFAAPFGASLFGKTVCIVGFGNIGRALGRLLRPFRCRIIGIRRHVGSGREGSAEVWPPERLRDALGLADYVAVTVPLTPATSGILGRAELEALKPGARIVNVSRGGTIDHDALLAALRARRVPAAGLDVFWQEPIPADDPILAENVTTTPHCGGLTDHMLSGTSRVAAENIQRALDGRRPRFRVRL